MNAQVQSTEELADRIAGLTDGESPKMPKLLTNVVPPEKANPHTPELKSISPIKSQIVKAIVDARVDLKRAYLKDIVCSDTWAVIEACGEPDYNGDPRMQAIKAMHCFMAIQYERTVLGCGDTALLKYEGWESSNFDHFKAKAEEEL